MVARNTGMSIPMRFGPKRSAAPELNEPHAMFEQPARQQAGPREIGAFLAIDAVERLSCGRLLRQVGRFGNRKLHPRGELITTQPAFEGVVSSPLGEMPTIHFCNRGKPRGLCLVIQRG